MACVRHIMGGAVKREVRSFQTTTKSLMALSQWLSAEGCTHLVMEATGVYWKPVGHILSDGEFELVLANAAHVKNVPGRKLWRRWPTGGSKPAQPTWRQRCAVASPGITAHGTLYADLGPRSL